MVLGQHFLVDREIINKICNYAFLSDEDAVLEIGCGTGNLTGELLNRAKKVYGIEIDRELIQLLEKRFKNEIQEKRFILVCGDALKVEFPKFDKFVSNIPYEISSPLTFKLFKHEYRVAVVMYQKEFAERLTASSGERNYGRLSIIAKSYCRAEILEFIPRTLFEPVPEVDSAIVRIVPEPELIVHRRELFEDLVRFMFSRRRKMVGKSILEWSKSKGFEIELAEDVKKKRPEELEPEFFAKFVDML
jgi:16S rRNA (adenine1518-N6/adenine1519-N6)-dimethyltransferase